MPIFSIAASSNPNLGLAIESATGMLTVTPTNGLTGVHSVIVRVRNLPRVTTSRPCRFSSHLCASAPDLVVASDTGSSTTDNITRLDNSTVANQLQFTVTGVLAGADVRLFAGGIDIGHGTVPAGATSITITTSGLSTRRRRSQYHRDSITSQSSSQRWQLRRDVSPVKRPIGRWRSPWIPPLRRSRPRRLATGDVGFSTAITLNPRKSQRPASSMSSSNDPPGQRSIRLPDKSPGCRCCRNGQPIVSSPRDGSGRQLVHRSLFTVWSKISRRGIAPAIDPISDQTTTRERFFHRYKCTDGNLPNDFLTFSLVSPPAGMTIDPVTGIINWTPGESFGGQTLTITVRVTDAFELTDDETFELLRERGEPGADGQRDEQSDCHRRPAAYFQRFGQRCRPARAASATRWHAGAPAGASINAAGVFSWTPTAAHLPGPHSIIVRVSDGTATSEQAFDVTLEDIDAVQVVDGDLVVEGTAGNDTVTIRGTSTPGRYEVTGSLGTTTVNGVTGELRLEFGDGDDTITLSGAFVAGRRRSTWAAATTTSSLAIRPRSRRPATSPCGSARATTRSTCSAPT